jgi:hypothetical protein
MGSYRDAMRAVDEANRATRDNDPTPPGRHRAPIAFAIGTILTVVGGVAFMWSSNAHSACGSALVQATDQTACAVSGAEWSGGILAVAAGLVLVLVGALVRRGG